MASTPQWKVYRGGKNGEYIAATKYAEDAAALVALLSDGVVKWDHKLVVWTEGAEEFSAAESYDRAAVLMNERYEEFWRAAKAQRDKRLDDLNKELAAPGKSMTIEKWRG